MATNTPYELVQYYQNLLIMQYLNKTKASGTIGVLASLGIIPQTSVQTLTFSAAPTSGAFVLSYNGNNTASINYNDSAATIQTKLQAVTGLSNVTVSGSIAGLLLTVTFTGVNPPALPLTIASNSLLATATAIDITIVEIDETLPLAIQDGFNLNGSSIAVGNQLDVIGKYVGVTRSGSGFSLAITLNDADFIQLIRMAITKNSAGSSLSTIQTLINQYFPGQIFVFDYANMFMTYIISASVGSQNLVQLFVSEGLLPIPMAVLVTVFYVPNAHLFSFRTYSAANTTGSPFNTYSSYASNTPFLSYANLVVA